MKKIQYIIVALFLLQINSAEAQTQTVNIKAPGFVRPLVERWIAEYQKINSDLSFQLGQKKDNAIIFVLEEREERKEERGETVFFGRYAIVPFTGKDSEAAALIAKKKLNDKRIKNLLFEKDDLSEEKSDKLEDKLHIYTGAQSFSVALPYAAAYGLTAADYRGKRIQGDDRFLNKAVGEDAWGLGISALGNLYDLQSRHLKDQLQVASLDDSKKMQLQGKEQLETLLYNRQVDVIIADRDVFTELAADGDVLDLSQVFTEKELTSFAAEMGREAGSGDDSYGGLLLKTPGYLESEDVDETGVGKGEEEYYGLDLTGCRLLSENDAGDSETSDLVLMVAGNTERLSGAVRFTEVLLELE